MRWLFLLVLILNIAYVGWEMNRPTEKGYVKKTLDGSVPALVLVSELEPEATVLAAKEKAIVTAKPESAKPVQEKKVLVAEKKLESVAKQTVSELKLDQLDKDTKPFKQVESCYTFGPFRTAERLASAERDIKPYVSETATRAREENERSMFWVYLAPEASAAAALKLSKRLIKNKIRDYYIITKQPNQHGISLGHFKDKERAYGHGARLKKLGFKAVVEPVFRTYTLYWLDYQLGQGRQIPSKIVSKHTVTGMNLLKRECDLAR